MTKPRTKEQVISNIDTIFKNSKYKFISFVEPYVNSRSKVVMTCREHGQWSVAIRHLTTHASSCPKCGIQSLSKKKSDNIQTVTLKIEKAALNKGYSFVSFAGDYKNRKSKIIINCETHGDYTSNINNFVDGDKGCPSCRRNGFNVSKVGYLYALRSVCGKFIKVGISNQPDVRLQTLVRRTPFEFHKVEIVRFENGKHAWYMEKIFHDNFTSAEFQGFDGCTEWLIWTPELQTWFRFL